jgi:hypothetical protein
MKILSVEVQLFHAERRTNITKLTVTFRNLAQAPTTARFTFNVMLNSVLGQNGSKYIQYFQR